MPGTILVVDDDWKVRQRLTSILHGAGYEVVAAGDGLEALEQMRAHPPDVTLLDMTMPVMDGWEVMAERRKHPRLQSVPVYIITALEIASTEWAKNLGAAGCLRKPLDVDRLLEAVGRSTGFERADLAASAPQA